MATRLSRLLLCSLAAPFCISAMTTSSVAAPAPAAVGGNVSLQLYGGARSLKPADKKDDSSDGRLEQSEKLTGSEFGLSTMVQPVALVPVSIGAYIVQQKFKGDAKEIEETFDGLAAGGQLMGWLDYGLLSPFVKTGYDFYSQHTYTLKMDEASTGAAGTLDAKLNGKVKGFHAALGVSFKPAPMMAFFMQAEYADQKFEVDEVSVSDGRVSSGLKLNTDEKKDFNRVMRSQAIIVGFDIGS